jgi:hypothetical protein
MLAGSTSRVASGRLLCGFEVLRDGRLSFPFFGLRLGRVKLQRRGAAHWLGVVGLDGGGQRGDEAVVLDVVADGRRAVQLRLERGEGAAVRHRREVDASHAFGRPQISALESLFLFGQGKPAGRWTPCVTFALCLALRRSLPTQSSAGPRWSGSNAKGVPESSAAVAQGSGFQRPDCAAMRKRQAVVEGARESPAGLSQRDRMRPNQKIATVWK